MIKDLSELKDTMIKLKAIEMFDSGMLDQLEVGTLASLAAINKYLYEDMNDYAGQFCDVRANGRAMYPQEKRFAKDTIETLDSLPMETYDEIIIKFRKALSESLFYEGNCRSARIWLEQMLVKKVGLFPKWERLTPHGLFNGPLRIDFFMNTYLTMNRIKYTTVKANEITREMFIRNLDASFALDDVEFYEDSKGV